MINSDNFLFSVIFKNEEENKLMQKFLQANGCYWMDGSGCRDEGLNPYGGKNPISVYRHKLMNNDSDGVPNCPERVYTINDLEEIKRRLTGYQVGDWIKTKSGYILKLINIGKGNLRYGTNGGWFGIESIERLATLEEIKEAMKLKYKVGDWIKLKNSRGKYWNSEGRMDKYLGQIVQIKDKGEVTFQIEGQRWLFNISDIERYATDYEIAEATKPIYKKGDWIKLKDRRGAGWNSEGRMDKYIGQIVQIKYMGYASCWGWKFTIKDDENKNRVWHFRLDDIERFATEDEIELAQEIQIFPEYIAGIDTAYEQPWCCSVISAKGLNKDKKAKLKKDIRLRWCNILNSEYHFKHDLSLLTGTSRVLAKFFSKVDKLIDAL